MREDKGVCNIITIKKNKDYWLHLVLYIVALAISMIVFVWGCDLSVEIALTINAPVAILILLNSIATGRTFILDETGCTVCFLKYKKRYTWSELKTKRIEQHHLPSMLAGRLAPPYTKEVIISPRKVHKPKSVRMELYSLIYPLSCVYVHFSMENDKYRYGKNYEIDEEIFWEKMRQWDVRWEIK